MLSTGDIDIVSQRIELWQPDPVQSRGFLKNILGWVKIGEANFPPKKVFKSGGSIYPVITQRPGRCRRQPVQAISGLQNRFWDLTIDKKSNPSLVDVCAETLMHSDITD